MIRATTAVRRTSAHVTMTKGRRIAQLLSFLVILLPAAARAASVEMMTTSGCSCCHAWARHLHAAGFEVTVKDLAMGQLMRAKLDAGVPATLAACHTARIGGYVVEGHVPAADIERLLAEKPDAVGIFVPGMPMGSPGMEHGDHVQPYNVLLLKKDGTYEIWASHG